MFRDGVNPSVGRTHAFDGWPRTATQGLRGAWTAQRNAAGKPSLVCTPRHMISRAHLVVGRAHHGFLPAQTPVPA